MKDKDLYIISFGTSNQYRFYMLHSAPEAKEIAEEIKRSLQKEFPDLQNMKFLDTAQIHRIGNSDEGKYQSYPILDAKAIREIENHLCIEAQNKEDVQQKILNAPFSDIN